MQISLQTYNAHKSKMHHIFPAKHDTRSKQNKSYESVYNIYKEKLIGDNQKEFNTLLLYVSPKELSNNSDMLPNLRQELENLELKKVYVGELSIQSMFYLQNKIFLHNCVIFIIVLLCYNAIKIFLHNCVCVVYTRNKINDNV